jgi:hypothetical protein
MDTFLKAIMAGLVLLIIAVIAGMIYAATEPFGPAQVEYGRVESLTYSPARTGTGVGTGVSANGHMVTTTTIVSIPEEYGILISCDHGVTFPVDGRLAEESFSRLKVGDSLRITYQESLRHPGTYRTIALEKR